MKLHKNIGIFLAAFLVLAQSACLKDNSNNANPSSGTNNVVEFQNTSVPDSYTSPFAQYDNGVDIDPVADTGGFRININYTGAVSVAPVDITVTLALSQSALDSFNNAVGTNLVIPPSDIFSFPATVTIPKGTRQVSFRPIITSAADYDYTQSYCLPLTITASSYGIISSNYGTAIFSFVANNQFAGNYTSTGYVFHPSAPRAINADYAVTTVDLITNQFPVGDLGGSGYTFTCVTPNAGGALSNFQPTGSTPAGTSSGFFTSDNPEGAEYATSAPLAPGTAPYVQSTYNNTYDATNKTYWLHYGYNGSPNAWTRQFYEKMVKDQ
jgi:hypothetical protein